MPDILFPPDLVPNTMMFGVDDFTAVDESATTGGMQSSALYGTRRWHLRMDFSVISRKNGLLARFEALTASLRGRANRVWISPAPAAKLRGSFPASEMYSNNDFGAGAAGWSADAHFSTSAIDKGLRITRNASIAFASSLVGGPVISVGIPYCVRLFINAGKGNETQAFADFTNSINLGAASISQGMLEACYTAPSGGAVVVGLQNQVTGTAGNYFDAKWASFSRGAQIDNGVNLLLNSDTPGSGTGWALTAATATSAVASGPDGALDAWSLTETTANSGHFADQNSTVSSDAGDYTASAFVFAGLRNWCFLQIFDGANTASAWFNASTGALGSVSIGTNFALISQRIVSYGNGWFRIILTIRKSSAATVLQMTIGSSTADLTTNFVGSAASPALFTWRASFAPSSVPVAPIQTSTTAQTGTLQTGYALNLKGLPVSTQGLLLEGDVVECLMPANSQLLRIVSRLDSDAAGLGTLFFENALKQSPADGAGVVVQQPMGRFVLAAATLGIEYSPGVFGQASLEFVEAA